MKTKPETKKNNFDCSKSADNGQHGTLIIIEKINFVVLL